MERIANNVTINHIIQAVVKTRAIPLPSPVQNQSHINSTHFQFVMKGMKTSWVIGQIKNAVIGDADCSILLANQNTRPSRSSGTTFCNIVCSIASIKGKRNIQINKPIIKSIIDGCIVKNIQTVQVIILLRNKIIKGFFPNHLFAIYKPHKIKLKLKNHQIVPQISTETNVRPYASIRAKNTQPRKLLKVVKNMRANNPGTFLTTFKVHFISTFFWLSSRMCIIFFSGIGRRERAIIAIKFAITAIIKTTFIHQ